MTALLQFVKRRTAASHRARTGRVSANVDTLRHPAAILLLFQFCAGPDATNGSDFSWGGGVSGCPMSESKTEWSKALSPREREVALLIGRGLSNKEVARALGLSAGTVKCHVHNILQKLGETRRYRLIAHLPSLPVAGIFAISSKITSTAEDNDQPCDE